MKRFMAANEPTILSLWSTILFSLLACFPASANSDDADFFVSVYQPRMVHDKSSKINRTEALAHMNRHIRVYEVQAEVAANRTSKMLVLPEYCLYADINDFSRKSMENFLEPIPDPKITFPWTPCDLENATIDVAVQKKFSCMAKKNGIYIVANVGEREDCNGTVKGCPYDGRYQYNTNVVYAPNGTLIFRYRKRHLFNEPYFNEPRVAQHDSFDTPFGRFTTITCFDIYFADTLNELITRQNVRNIIFPNMWFNLPPLFLSIPFHSSIAWAANINLISSNLILDKPPNITSFVSGGSMVYSGDSIFAYIQTPNLLSVKVTNIKPGASFNFGHVPKRATPTPSNQTVYSFLVGEMEIKAIPLLNQEGQISVCHGNFCCGLEYELVSKQNSSLAYWLGAMDFSDGSRQEDAQACVLCIIVLGKRTCEGIPADKDAPYARFKRLRMFANSFKTPFLYPQVSVMRNGAYRVLRQDKYYNQGEIKLVGASPLHSMVLLGRVYPPLVSSTSHPVISGALMIGLLFFCML